MTIDRLIQLQNIAEETINPATEDGNIASLAGTVITSGTDTKLFVKSDRIESILSEILIELRILNNHMSIVTDEEDMVTDIKAR